MRVLLKLILDCDPDAAWRALRSPTVMREVASPLVDFASLERTGFPDRWTEGPHPVRVLAGGVAPVAHQDITIGFPTSPEPGTRIIRDTGGGQTGAMRAIRRWDHRMAVAADPADTGRTLYRDQLRFDAGPASAALWPMLWANWQWRGIRLQALAPSWSSDAGEPGTERAAA